jgi:uncharacterized protein YhbP (UPF0306 family)
MEFSMAESDQEFVRNLVRRNRYLTLATTDGEDPWITPLEYLSDDKLNLYYFSPENADHSRHLTVRANVAFTIFDAVQPEYEPAPLMRIAGIQATATAQKLDAPFPALVVDQIEAWKLPMPPYAVYQIIPKRWFIPVIKDGVNGRVEVSLG